MGVLRTATVPDTRLRLNGVTKSKDAVKAELVSKLIIAKMMTPTQMSGLFGMSREHFSRDYLYPMVVDGTLKKIEGSNNYALVQTTVTGRDQVQRELLVKSEFFEKCTTIQNWIANNGAKGEVDKITKFINICLGKYNPKFKINPDNWKHPETTLQLKIALEEFYGKKLFPWDTRQCVRQFLDKGCNIKLNKSEMERLGFSGEKTKPLIATLHMTRDQYNKCKDLLRKNTWEFVKFGFSYWTFCRPSSKYIVRLDQLEFFDRVVEYVVKSDGTQITDPDRVKDYKEFLELNPQLSEKIKIYSRVERACRLELFEHKTQKPFPKRIYDQEVVLELEKFVRVRKSQHKKYLFWENNDTEFTFENYDDIVKRRVLMDNQFYKDLFLQVGFTKESFGSAMRCNYAIRHFGLQGWLQLTDYDFGFVSTMSHDDIATLKRWYGEFAAEHLEKKMLAVVF